MQPHALAAVFYGLTLAAASAAGFEGTYKSAGGGYSQEADITRGPDGRYKVEVYVGTDGCSGAIGNIFRRRPRLLQKILLGHNSNIIARP